MNHFLEDLQEWFDREQKNNQYNFSVDIKEVLSEANVFKIDYNQKEYITHHAPEFKKYTSIPFDCLLIFYRMITNKLVTGNEDKIVYSYKINNRVFYKAIDELDFSLLPNDKIFDQKEFKQHLLFYYGLDQYSVESLEQYIQWYKSQFQGLNIFNFVNMKTRKEINQEIDLLDTPFFDVLINKTKQSSIVFPTNHVQEFIKNIKNELIKIKESSNKNYERN